ncbi:MAG TPA: AAA family ATPase [Candidatus Norongarragalinales archaeon]|jgi:cell division control protein 6|nr:AAA family ATPase [Candidatus Norongarragalinales archaeon]
MVKDDFDDVIGRPTVFKDRGVLSPHYMPSQLLHREDQTKHLVTALAPVLQHSRPKNVFLYGKSGTGKTSVAKHVLGQLTNRNLEHVKSVYMNCRVYDSRYKVLQRCIADFSPGFAKTGHSFARLYETFLDWLEGSGTGKGRHALIVLDEVDMVHDLDGLLYTLTRANDDLKIGSVSVVGISNKIDFKNKLDSRSKSSLCEQELVFSPYDATQLRGILQQRAGAGFREGVLDEAALGLAAAIAAGENGDARYALSLLLRAGELADQRSQKISEKEVEEARKAADEDKAFEVISSLPEHQQLALYALAQLASEIGYKKLVEDGGEKMYFSGEVYQRYAKLVKKLGKEPRTPRWYREYLHDLETMGLITTIESGKGVRGHATLLRLGYPADKVKSIVEKTLLAE